MPSSNAKLQIAMPAKRMTTGAAAAASAVSNSSVTNNNSLNAATRQAMPLEISAVNPMMNGMVRLTPARDLTLGGRGSAVSVNKKVFAPNLNAVRNKNTSVKTSKDFTAIRGSRRGGRGGAGTAATRGRGGSSTLIQTTGVFSEGAGALHVRKSTGNGTAYVRSGDEATITRKRTDRKHDEKTTEIRMRELLGGHLDIDEDEDGSDMDVEIDKTDLKYKPVMLCEGLWQRKNSNVKKEPCSAPNLGENPEDSSAAVAQDFQNLYVESMVAGLAEAPPQYGRYPRNMVAFLESTQSQIFMMQMPDVLPNIAYDEDKNESEKKEGAKQDASKPASPSTTNSTEISSTTTAPKCNALNNLEEGQIGKILRYRSGRVQLLLGDTRFDLEMGLESGFLQELMSISTNREQRSGDMVNLGPIQAKLKAIPDWVDLFAQQDAAARDSSISRTKMTSATINDTNGK